jgi:hypothetical protein
MITDRFVRNIWAINGVIFLGFFAIAFLFAAIVFVQEWMDRDPIDEIIVGEKLEEAKDKGLALQGLEYHEPVKVYGSSGYVLPINIKTYQDPRKLSKDAGIEVALGNVITDYYTNTVNVIFLNEKLEVKKSLLDKKAFIQSFDYPIEPTPPYGYPQAPPSPPSIFHITYLIAFEDSNKNGSINLEDDFDLYISSLDGDSLEMITNNVNVSRHQFLTPNEILISYSKRDNVKEEHKRKYYAKYFIKEKKLVDLTSIDKELDIIESVLTK